jgi:serine/threonine protein phosphatase PrpC
MRGCCQRLSEADFSSASIPALRHAVSAALAEAHHFIRDQSPPGDTLGGSTACVAIVEPTRGLFCGASIGDSGWRIFRGGEVVAASEEQRHSAFTPWQLSKGLPGMNVIDDNALEADIQLHVVQPGDVIVMATDGLWDNSESSCHPLCVCVCVCFASHWVDTRGLAKGRIRPSLKC